MDTAGPDSPAATSLRTRLRVALHVLRGRPVAYRLSFPSEGLVFLRPRPGTIVLFNAVGEPEKAPLRLVSVR